MKRVHLLLENMLLIGVWWFQIDQKHFKHFSRIPPFFLYNNNLNFLIFRVCLPLGEPLMTTFNESRAPAFRKNLDEQDIVMPNWSKTFQTFWLHFSVLALQKHSRNLNFQSFFTSKKNFRG